MLKMVPKEFVEKLTEFARGDNRIVAAFVFGSMATDRARVRSDMDVAIMTRGSVEGIQKIRWETALSTLLGEDVDVVIFSEATPLLQHQILKDGFLVYDGDLGERVRQEVVSRHRYLDTQFLYRLLDG